jgi:hypothetical protein
MFIFLTTPIIDGLDNNPKLFKLKKKSIFFSSNCLIYLWDWNEIDFEVQEDENVNGHWKYIMMVSNQVILYSGGVR